MFQPATLSPFPRTQSKMQEVTTVKPVYISLGFLQHVAKTYWITLKKEKPQKKTPQKTDG